MLSVLLTSNNKKTISDIESFKKKFGILLTVVQLNENTLIKALDLQVDLLLYDMDGHSMNHLETLRILKKLLNHVPIVVLTEDNSIETMKYLAQLKIYYSALKPIRKTELEGVLHGFEAMQDYRSKRVSIAV